MSVWTDALERRDMHLLETIISTCNVEQYDFLMQEHGNDASLLPFFVIRTNDFNLMSLYLGATFKALDWLFSTSKGSLDIIALALECGANPTLSKRIIIGTAKDTKYTDLLAVRLLSPIEDTTNVFALILMLAAAGGNIHVSCLLSNPEMFQSFQRLYDIEGKTMKTQAEYEEIWQKACSREAVQKFSFDRTKKRALQVCIAMQDLDLPAWCTLRILLHLGEPFSRSARLDHLWKLVTTVKHFSLTDAC